jgi:hypothetical protein
MNATKPASNAGRFQKTTAIVASLCLVLLSLAGCEPEVKTVEKTSDQAKLSRIAVEAKDWGVREAAVRKLTDQGVMERVVTGDKNVFARRAAAEKLTNQALLAKVAVEDEARLSAGR